MDTRPAAESCYQRIVVRCDYCGEEHLTDNPFRPSCDECDAEMRAQFEASLSEILIPEDEASRYEAEMERRATR